MHIHKNRRYNVRQNLDLNESGQRHFEVAGESFPHFHFFVISCFTKGTSSKHDLDLPVGCAILLVPEMTGPRT